MKLKNRTLRISSVEISRIQKKADLANITFSQYVRKALKNSRPIFTQVIKPERSEMLREIAKIGNNLNQLAKHCNSQGEIDQGVLISIRALEARFEQICSS